MKKTITIICFLLAVAPCIAQNDHIELDTNSFVGVNVINQGKRLNALSLLWQINKSETVKLTPYEAKSYSTGKKEYVAKDIEINGEENRFFLEKMASGNLTLFFIQNEGKHFFVEKDSVLSKLSKNDYKGTLQSLCADCDYTGSFLKHTQYNSFFLKRFTERYNLCEEVYRPVRFGVIGGLDFTGYSMLKDAWKVSSAPTGSSFTFGVFADIPLFHGSVSFHPEFLYSKQAYKLVEKQSDLQEKECIANIESYSIPLLIRNTWWKSKWSPFLNVGAVWHNYSRLENSVLTASTDKGVLVIQKTEPELSPSKYSVTGGAGVWYKINRRNAIFVEVRSTLNLNKVTHNVFAGINF